MGSRVTLKDVAARANVSYQTVSKVLNGKAQVAPETEARIWAAVKELGYRPNVLARSLRKQSSQLIGYSWHPLPPDQANPILDKFLSSVVKAAEAAGYHLLLFPTALGEDPADTYGHLISTNRVDGFILGSTNYEDPRIRLLIDLDFPFVAFGRSDRDLSFPYVDVDGRAGMREATQHLLEQGHRRIGLLAWPDSSRSGAARKNGYLQAMSEAGIEVDPAWIKVGEGLFEVGYRLTAELLDLPEDRRPTAVAAVTDQLAIGAIRAAQDRGLAVGPEFGVTGFDDTPGIQHLTPPLTSVRQPIWDVGQRIVEMLVALIEGKEPEQREILLPPRLIVRESSLRKGLATTRPA